MDFVFGTFATDQLRMLHHQTMRQGLQHRHMLEPADPLPGEPVTLTVWVGVDTDISHLVAYFTTAEHDPAGSLGQSSDQVAHFHLVAYEWDALAWGYFSVWKATLPAQPDGTIVRYRIGGWADGGDELFADYPLVNDTMEHAADAFFKGKELTAYISHPGPGAVFTYRVDRQSSPAWVRDAVVYQVFVDRFYPGDGKSWTQTDDVHRLMGGTLNGVRDKLGYLADLGITCIWLSPTWESGSYHGYDIMDYCRTADWLGGDDALRRLVQAAHARGIRVLLDLACNHMSNESAVFKDAQSDSASAHRDWFTFDDSPIGYKTFFNVRQMPQINLRNPRARDWMLDIARYWIREFDVDGYRLDYAHGPGPDFWTYFNAACKEVKSDALTFGEIIDSPEAQRAYIGRLDGCLDFFANEAMRKTFGWRTQDRAGLDRRLARHRASFPQGFVMPAFLDNHDMNRFLHIAGGDKSALREAFAYLMDLPNLPIVYYGTEAGLSHERSTREGGLDVSRMAMPWGSAQDAALRDDFAAMIAGRRARLAEAAP